MAKLIRIVVVVLLLVNGIGALYGGGSLILHPDGSGLGMPLSMLQFTPFNDFLVPGIILFVSSGLFSLLVLASLIAKVKYYPWYVMAQGAILLGWIVIQILLIRGIDGLHYIFGGIGVLLILLGFLLLKTNNLPKTGLTTK